jgi:DNA-binding LacI/PurR family transcriptional regulator
MEGEGSVRLGVRRNDFDDCGKLASLGVTMKTVRRRSLAEVTADFVREGLETGRWNGRMPGVLKLAGLCGVSRQTMRAAMRILEVEGVIASAGVGRRRTVTGRSAVSASRTLRIGVLLREPLATEDPDQQTLFLELRRAIETAGHECQIAARSQNELGDNLGRIQRHMDEIRVDGWVVHAGSRELLEWGIASGVPMLALGGHARSLPMASTGADSIEAYRAAVRHLVGLGHHRIVLLAPHQFRHPEEMQVLKEYKAELEAQGIAPSSYHVPDWEETPEGLERELTSLFRITPPTALVVLKTKWAVGVLSFLARRRLRVPEDVSLVSWGHNSELAWHRPAMAHFASDQELMVRRILRWIRGLAKGRPDHEFQPIPLTFVAAGTTGPAKG